MLGIGIRRAATGACRSAPATYKTARGGRLCVLLSCVVVVQARPVPRDDSSSQSSGNNSILTTWIPVVIVVMVIVGVSVFSWTKAGRRLIQRVRGLTSGSPAAPVNAATAAPAATAARPRRAPRRRASQISTKSLPAYMEEPGDQELVLVRRAPSQEDNDGLLANSSPADSISLVTPSPDEPSTTLDPIHLSLQPHSHPADDPVRPSIDTTRTEFMGSDESSTSLMHSLRRHLTSDTAQTAPQLGEAAPSYLDVVTPEEIQRRSVDLMRVQTGSSAETVPDLSGAGPAETARPANPRRRSGFMGIFNPRASVVEPAAAAAAPAAERTSWLPRAAQRGSQHPPRPTHAPSTSVTSLLSFSRSTSPLPTPSSSHPLTSPSVTSLSSLAISAPLPHTLTRSEFSYPRAGPTPEQIKFISSRESLGRFGVPFGVEARAAAAATARGSGEAPPPAFEEEESGEGRQRRSSIEERIDEEEGGGGTVRVRAAVPATTQSASAGEDAEADADAEEEIEDTSNQATIRAHPRHPHPPLPTASSPIAEEQTPTRSNHAIPLSSPIPDTHEHDAFEVSIIPATPVTSVPTTPVAHTPPPPPSAVVGVAV